MKTVYTLPKDPASSAYRQQLFRGKVPFKDIQLGIDMPLEEFAKKFPYVTLPYVEEEDADDAS